MSSKAKGRRTLNKAIDYLVKDGYIVDEVEQGGRFRKFKDLFAGYCVNCWKREEECCDDPEIFEGFDLIAVKLPVVKLIQVKTNQPPTQKNYKKFASSFAGSHLQIEAFTWYDRRGFVIHKFLSNGKVKRIDLRN